MNVRSEEKDKRSRIILGAIILLLFIVNGLLIYKLIDKQNQNDELEVEKTELQEERAQILQELKETEGELIEVRGENEMLDSTIRSKNSEIAQRIAELRKIVSDKNATVAQLRKARDENNDLRQLLNRYEFQIDSMRLTITGLQDTLSVKNRMIEQQKEDYTKLEANFEEAARKVKIGSRLEAIDLVATGVKERRRGGKEVSRLSAADKVRISFTLDKNDVAEKGERVVYLKLITPSEATLYNESKGSGSFSFNGEQSLYTLKQTVNFQNKNESVVFNWDKSPGMMEGEYEAYIISEDHIIGRQKFILK